MAEVSWEQDAGGIRYVTLETADGHYATLAEGVWKGHVLHDHPCMADHYEKVVETLAGAYDIHESRTDPRNRLLYVKWYPDQSAIPGECLAKPTLIVVVNRQIRTVVTAYFADFVEGKLGKRIWPK